MSNQMWCPRCRIDRTNMGRTCIECGTMLVTPLSGPNKQYIAPDSSHEEFLRLTRLERQNDILKTALRNLISVCDKVKYNKIVDAAIEALEGK